MAWLDAAQWIARAVRYTGTDSGAPHMIADNPDEEESLPPIEPVDVWSQSSPAACHACAGQAATPSLAGAGRRGTTPASDGRPRRPKVQASAVGIINADT
eukprot:10870809-Heterocapsa_arctica.AAC.1